jgi:hypothetical protein
VERGYGGASPILGKTVAGGLTHAIGGDRFPLKQRLRDFTDERWRRVTAVMPGGSGGTGRRAVVYLTRGETVDVNGIPYLAAYLV